MHIIDAQQKNSKRKCGETVKNLPIFVVTMPRNALLFHNFAGPARKFGAAAHFFGPGATF